MLEAFQTPTRRFVQRGGNRSARSVSPGEYRIQMGSPSPEMYLKEVTFDRR